jgi:hypothetical protein
MLSRNPARVVEVMEQVTRWLESWNMATRGSRTLTPKHLRRHLLAPAQALGHLLDGDAEYVSGLSVRIAALRRPVPAVVAHNDLTMWNLFCDDQDRLGVIDWEAADADCLPLTDFFYAMTDAVLTSGTRRERLTAFESCFSPDGAYAPVVRKLERRLRYALEISDDLAELALHACFLGHACNEHRRGQPPSPRPFLQIVRRLVGSHQARSFTLAAG